MSASTDPEWRVLVVDDSAEDRADARRMLLRGCDRRYEFREAETAASAIRLILDQPPDCVVLDHSLPDGDALDVLAAIRRPDGASACPVVVLTGKSSAPAANEFLRAGAQDFVGKSWATPESLTRAVESAVERWTTMRAHRASEARFRQLANAVPEAVWVTDEAGALLDMNDKGRALFGDAGLDEAISLSRFLETTLHPEERLGALAFLDEVSGRTQPCVRDLRLRTIGGEYRWFQLTVTPTLDDQRELTRFYAVAVDIHERKEAKLRLQLALRASSTGIWTWDVRTDAVEWSPEAYAIHGVQQGSFAGTGAAFFALVHPDDRAHVETCVRAAIREREMYTAEFRVVRPDGAVVWVQNLGRALYDEAGAVRVVGTIVDVNARKQAEAALLESEREIRAIADASPHVITRFDRSGRCVFVSAAVEKLSGLPPAHFIGKTNRELGMPDPVRIAFDATLAELFAGAAPSPFGCALPTAHGERHFETHLAPQLDETGAVHFAVAVTHDVTAQREAEAAIKISEERLARAQEAARVGTWDWDVPGDRAVWTDEAWRLYTGRARSQKQVDFELWLSCVHPDDREKAAARSKAALSAGRYRDEFRVVHANGEIVWLEADGEAQLDANGAPVRLLGTVRDVTERRAAREALEAAVVRAERAVLARDQLVSLVSHDLRNPLTALSMGLLQLRTRVVGDDAPSIMQRLQRQVGRMSKMIEELLDVSQLRVGKTLDLELREVDLVKLSLEAVEEFRLAAPGRVIVLETQSEALTGLWDEMRIERVIRNLLSNAIKYSPSGGPVRVAVEQAHAGDEPMAVLRVTDEGLGISPVERESIFEWFSRGENARRIPGIGIGLAGVRDIVGHHGGSIDVDSSPGEGSTFTVRLPVRGHAQASS